MPLVHERTFRVRHYECDAYGHVNHANYLRYMQETALDASAAAGYDMARYEALGCHWLIRETDITYLRPLAYGDWVLVKTWVADFRRVRSRRAYELREVATGEVVAEAHTDWVFLDSQTLRPASVPAEMKAAFFPEGPPAEAPRREPFPEAPPPPPGVFTLLRHVEWRDIDPAGHVNNASAMAYFEDCGVQVAAAYGWPMARMMAAGFGIVARRYRIEYREPAMMGDELEVATWVSDARRATAVRHYTIHRAADKALLARAHVLWVWVDLATGRPIRIPADFLADFGPNIAASENRTRSNADDADLNREWRESSE
ncbi:MAG: thioesterase [Chloroflexi bacterium]|nr:thioesterase [Chloroflexota bacterium]MCI0575482.1 thioesterase [Chloroflexota bacterium]MCI0646664.1 thioesterase [Chloroflexota bacterium]MCI0726393.1 thioesterase [Chloroflexota bacterium]